MTAPTIYRGDGWEVRCGRWQDSPPDAVDVVISDPPYSHRTHSGQCTSGKDGAVRRDIDYDHMTTDGAFALAAQMAGFNARWNVVFSDSVLCEHYRSGFERAGLTGFAPVPCVINGMTVRLSGDGPSSWAVYLNCARTKSNNRCGTLPGAYVGGTGAQEDRIRIGGKPLWLMLAIVGDYSDPDELVWDPYCGSGTTGVACLRLGRRFLGHEMQPHYAEIAAERLEAETRGLTLQDVRRGQTSILDRLEQSPLPEWLKEESR